MSLEDFKDKFRWALDEAWCKGNLDALDEVYAAEGVNYQPPFPAANGLEAMKQALASILPAYSDIQITYHEWIAEGNAIAFRATMNMRHTGQSPTFPIPPTGKELTLQTCAVCHLKDGKVIEEWDYSDYLGIMQQLGIVPS